MKKYKNVYEECFSPKATVYQLKFDTTRNLYFADTYLATLVFGQKLTEETYVRLDNDTPVDSIIIHDSFLKNAYKITGKNPSRHANCFDQAWFALFTEVNVEEGNQPLNTTFALTKREPNEFTLNLSFFHSCAYVFKTSPILVSIELFLIAVLIKLMLTGFKQPF